MSRFEEGAGYARDRLSKGITPTKLRYYADLAQAFGDFDDFDRGMLAVVEEWERDHEPT